MLREYYDALENVVSMHGATLVNFFGDGVMVLLNAPVACADPAAARRPSWRSTCR